MNHCKETPQEKLSAEIIVHIGANDLSSNKEPKDIRKDKFNKNMNQINTHLTAQIMIFSIKDFFYKCEQICSTSWKLIQISKNFELQRVLYI